MTMEYVTLDDVRLALKHDEISGELVNTTAAIRLSAQYVKMYDPPVDGVTPEDGEGKPRTSDIGARDSLRALDLGYTEKPVTKRSAAAAARAEAKAEAEEAEPSKLTTPAADTPKAEASASAEPPSTRSTSTGSSSRG